MSVDIRLLRASKGSTFELAVVLALVAVSALPLLGCNQDAAASNEGRQTQMGDVRAVAQASATAAGPTAAAPAAAPAAPAKGAESLPAPAGSASVPASAAPAKGPASVPAPAAPAKGSANVPAPAAPHKTEKP